MGCWKKEKIIVVFALSLFTAGFSQQESYIKPGLLSASGTLSPSKMLNRNEVNYYIMGFLEGRFSKHFSARGDIYYLLGNPNTKFLKNSIRSTLGIQYGLPFGNFELHTGFAPGFSIMKSYRDVSVTEFVPTVQLNIGLRYYVWKYFHFFANLSYFHSKMQNLYQLNGEADELLISVGLGFNLQTIRKK